MPNLMRMYLIDENVFPYKHVPGFWVNPDIFNHFKKIAVYSCFIQSILNYEWVLNFIKCHFGIF